GLLKNGVDTDLIKEAFDKRFEEIELQKMRQHIPGLLPEDQRPPFVDPEWDNRDDPVPAWLIAVHVLFMGWTIFNAHYPALFIPGLLFFLGFAQVTSPFQNRIDLKPPLLVGFFLGGLVVHGGVQGWWIEPVLGKLSEIPLMLGATILTAFNDNAAITFLSTLVPGFTDSLKYTVVAGAVAGGGLTVIANAPNPAGQSLLKKHFDGAVSPVGLLKGALVPTIIVWLCFVAVIN
ncbi:MAG: putative Na+/H+ antiporter, partial [Desulfobacterales bacterium]